MLDKNELEIIPEGGSGMQTILERTGNKDRGGPRGLKSRSSFLRIAFREARKAWIDLKSGTASDFQLQMITEVWPLLKRRNRWAECFWTDEKSF